jgi:hypothetical protein
MAAEPNIDKLGPLALPVGLILSILTLILAVTKIIPEVGLKVAAVISFLVLLGWSIWFLSKRSKRWQVIAPLLPLGALGLCVFAFFPNAFSFLFEEDYSWCLSQSGGSISYMVVFDSQPRGAQVRYAQRLNAESDPLLESNEGPVIQRLFDRTPACTLIAQNHYRAVFELNGKKKSVDFTVPQKRVVKVAF